METLLERAVDHRIPFVIVAAATTWCFAAARRRAPRRTSQGIVLEMPLRTASILSAVFIFAVNVWLWSVVAGLGTRLLALWLFVGVVGGFFVMRMVGVRHELLERGIRYKTRFNGLRLIHWHDIREIRHDRFKDSLEIGLRDGTWASVSMQIIGLPDLARALLDNVPSHTEIDPRAHALLSDSLAGTPAF